MTESADWTADLSDHRPTIYLSDQELLDLHAYIIERYGGRLGISSQDRLTTVLDAPRQVVFGAELYPDVPSKAAALAFLLLKGRPFLSGNQGTALLALLRFVQLNDLTLRPEIGASELRWLIHSVDTSAMDKQQLEAWLRENLVPDL